MTGQSPRPMLAEEEDEPSSLRPRPRRSPVPHTDASAPLPRRAARFVTLQALALVILAFAVVGTATATTVEKRTVASTDDAEEFATGSMYLTSSDLELIHDSSDQTVGMRWTGLAIPAGSTITAAYIQFAAKESQSEATSLTLSAQAADNAATFGTTSANISSRPRTAATAPWAPVAWTAGNVGANQRTPDLAAVIQEVVSRPGWASGNALALIVTGTGHRTAWAYDGSSSLAPLLHVEFGSAPPPTDTPPTASMSVTSSGLTVTANGSASTDTDATPIASYRFDFGDGTAAVTTTAPTATAQHAYAAAGTYTVTLTATDTGNNVSAPATASVTLAQVTSAVDEIHWTFTGQTSVTFDWRGTENTIRYGLTTTYGQTVAAVTPSPLPYSSAGPFWEARITGLQENTSYHYSIANGPDHVFKTPLPRGASGFTVYVEGDVGNKTNWPRMGVIQGMIAAGRPDFVLMVGDLTYANPAGQAAVDRHFNDIMVWSQDAADMPAWGNHEWTSTSDDLRNYKGRFDFPNPKTSPGSPSISCCGEDWYWFDYGNVRFIAYPESWSGAWSDWNTNVKPIMDQAQSDPAIKFIVTFGHKPAYSSGYHAGDSSLKTILDALGASHSKYVLNLNGHSHDYERSYPQSGVTHITAAPGGTNLEEASGTCLWSGGCPPPAWSAYRAMHHTAVKLRFTATGIEGTVYCGPVGDTGSNKNDITCTQGNVIDSFVIGTTTADRPPVVTAPGAATVAEGSLLMVSVTASDPDGDPIATLMAPALPAGATFTPEAGNTNGTLSWTPSSSEAGSYTVTFTAANSLSGSASTAITVSITGATGVDAGAPGGPRAWIAPTPLRGSGVLHFVSTRDGPVTVTVFDVRGRIVRQLMEHRTLPSGFHHVDLDGRDDRGDAIPSGVYLYRVSLPGRLITGKVLIVH